MDDSKMRVDMLRLHTMGISAFDMSAQRLMVVQAPIQAAMTVRSCQFKSALLS
jgi:hypothetical protein